jgi:MYXO-CTERM domain-containing protein
MKRKLASIHTGAALLIAAAATIGSVSAAAVIYEPFDGAVGNLDGSAGGTGLTGNWSISGDFQVTTGSMSWGSLETSGNQTSNSQTRGKGGSVSTGTTLSGGGHLDNGAVLWFSFLAQSVPAGRTYMTIGTGGPDGFDRIGGVGGFGLGARLENGTVYAHGWDDTTAVKPAGTAVTAGTVFVVGRITWGATALDDDTVDIFLPGTDLVLPGTAASTMSRNFDQSTFTNLGIGSAGGGEVDEIRFGTSYADISPIPEPSAVLLGALGFLALLRRRRN